MKILMRYVPRIKNGWNGNISTDPAWLTDGCALFQVGDVRNNYKMRMERAGEALRRVSGESSKAVWDGMMSLHQFSVDQLGTMNCTPIIYNQEDPDDASWSMTRLQFIMHVGSGKRFVTFDADRLQLAIDATNADTFVVAFANAPVAIGRRGVSNVFALSGLLDVPEIKDRV